MSFFFNKDEGDENLQYDDTAFYHFGLASSVITIIVLLAVIYREILLNRIYNIKTLQKLQVFKQRLKNGLKSKKSYFKTPSFLVKFIIILVLSIFAIFCYTSVSADSKMIGFDPYEILGVPIDAQVNTIKKSYRKLALHYHPDRNSNNPEAAAKFIQISKAYKCLTDEQAKQNCKKYGNPDGAVSIKVGIGLPKFMIQGSNQYFYLIPIFVVLLFIVPRSFILWSNRQRPTDSNGNLISNYEMLYSYINPMINPITFSIIFGSMKELDNVFPEKKTLEADKEKQFRELLLYCRAITQQKLDKIPSYIIYRICIVYFIMAGRDQPEVISEVVPEICRKIILFTLFYTQRINDQKLLLNNPNYKITFMGVQILQLATFFYKQMMNPSVLLGNTRSIQFLDLTEEEQTLAKNIPIGHLQENLLWNEQAIDSLVKNFSNERQQYVRQQIECLPALKVAARVLVGEEEVKQMTIDDFSVFQVKIVRKKQTPGYVISRGFQYLAQQQFVLLICYGINLIYFQSIKFQKGQKQITCKYEHRQTFPKQMKFDVKLLSCNYPNMDIQTPLHINVLPRVQNRTVQIHKQDLNIERSPKNFFESMLSMDAYQEQDRQLSDGEDEQEQPVNRMKQEEEQEHSGGHKCCDHDHGEQNKARGFKEESDHDD